MSDGGGYVIPEGQGDMTLGFTFEAATNALETRGVQGDLDFGIRDLTVFFYDAKNGTEDDNQAPVYTFTFNRNDFDVYEKEHRDPAHCEEWTYHGLVTIKDVEYGAYRIYGVANAKYLLEQQNGAATANENEKVTYNLTEKQLRELKVCWDCNDNDGLPASQYKVPDAMFGYFTVEGVQDHTAEKYRNVIYHQDLGLYEGNAESSTDHKGNNRAGVVVLNKRSLEVQAWLKRVVSKVTVGFDGTGLKSGVEVYIKSVSIVDAPTECYLGQDNSVSSDTEFVNDEELTDARLNIIYSDVAGANGYVLSKEYPAFPRAEQNSKIDPEVEKETNVWDWNPEWYDYVHGSLENTNPTWNDQPITLYFLENLQGVDTEHPKVKLQSKESNDHYASEDHVTDAENCTYYKDGKPYGTYVEVKAYYRNTKKQTQGEITYRFMLGKNIENDFNAERNHHYKLTMSFLGDANNVDWHIDYEEEKKPYFPIPTEEQWNQSWVWHAYDDAGNPIAEMVKELVYYDPKDPNFEYGFVPKEDERYYFQVVTVYPVINGETDLSNGRIAQVLHCDNSKVGTSKGDAVITDFLDKLGKKVDVKVSMHRRGIAFSNKTRKPNTSNSQNVMFYRGYYVIESLDWNWVDGAAFNPVKANHETAESQENEKWIILADDETEDKYEFVEVIEGADIRFKLGHIQTKEYRIAPFYMTTSENNYPVVKVGASYWMREDFKGTKYADGQDIYPYQTDDVYGYTHNAPKKEYVNFDDKFPMYLDTEYGRLYNFFAASGAYDPYNHTTNDKGYTDHTECDPYFDYVEDPEIYFMYSHPANLKFANEWNLPTTYGIAWEWDKVPNPDPKRDEDWWAKTMSDHLYICEYMGNNYCRSGKDWGNLYVGICEGMENLSGLSFLPVPATCVATDAAGHKSINADAKISFAVKDNNPINITNAYIPFWDGHLVEDGDGYYHPLPCRLIGEQSSYPDCIYIIRNDTENEIIPFSKEVNKAYLPIRLIRDRMDYSVENIEAL